MDSPAHSRFLRVAVRLDNLRILEEDTKESLLRYAHQRIHLTSAYISESGQLDKRCKKRGNREVGEKQTSESERNLGWTLGERERERAGEQAVINHDHNENDQKITDEASSSSSSPATLRR